VRHFFSVFLFIVTLSLITPVSNLFADDGPGGVRFDRNDEATDQNALDSAIGQGFIRPAGPGETGETDGLQDPPPPKKKATRPDSLGNRFPQDNVGTGLPPLGGSPTPGEYEWESGKLWRQLRDGKLTREEYVQAHKDLRTRLRGGVNRRQAAAVNTREIGIDTGQIAKSERKKSNESDE